VISLDVVPTAVNAVSKTKEDVLSNDPEVIPVRLDGERGDGCGEGFVV
jgi:hypothetical protein